MDLTKRLKSAYDICVGSSELTKTHKDKIHYYLAVRTIVFKITTGGAPDVEQMNRRVGIWLKMLLSVMESKRSLSWVRKTVARLIF